MINSGVVFVVKNDINSYLYNIPYEQLSRYIDRLKHYNVDFYLDRLYYSYYFKQFSILNNMIVEENIKTKEKFSIINFTKMSPGLFQKLKTNYKFINLCEKYTFSSPQLCNFDLKKFLFFEDCINNFLNEDIIFEIKPRPTEIEINNVLNIHGLRKDNFGVFFMTPEVTFSYSHGRVNSQLFYIKSYFKELNYLYKITSFEFCVINKDLLSSKKYSDLFINFKYIDENNKEYQSLRQELKNNISNYIQKKIVENRRLNISKTVNSQLSNNYASCRFCGKPVIAGSDICYACS